MKKSDRKLDNKLRSALTEVCEKALDEIEGFKWLTHLVNFNNFPKSLLVICVFETNSELDNAKMNGQIAELKQMIANELAKAHFNIKDLNKHIKFDTEENCDNQNSGRWNQRLS
jgi:hypothetical protein